MTGTPRRTLLLCLAAALAVAAVAVAALARRGDSHPAAKRAAPYSAAGPYLDFANGQQVQQSDRIRFDRHGIPLVQEPSGWEYNPVTVSQWGLQGDAVYKVHQRPAGARVARTAADWLVHHQARSGGWLYRFDFSPAGIDAPLHAPWMSAMAQGNAISLLTRVYRRTHDRRYLRAAERGLLPLEKPVTRGGLTAYFKGHPIYEEFPTRPPSFALNGFMFTLLGLYDMQQTAPHSAAGRLFDRGLASLRFALPYYDIPGSLSAYHLAFITQRGQPVHQSLFYHRVHVQLLTALDQVHPDATLRHYRDYWGRYVPKPGDPP